MAEPDQQAGPLVKHSQLLATLVSARLMPTYLS